MLSSRAQRSYVGAIGAKSSLANSGGEVVTPCTVLLTLRGPAALRCFPLRDRDHCNGVNGDAWRALRPSAVTVHLAPALWITEFE
jgi:hypothetical protein